jgi:hypothetical protein
MSKIEEIDKIAQYQADVILETLKEQVEWAIADYDLKGDDYYNLRDYIVHRTATKLLEEVATHKNIRGDVWINKYKQNTIISG